MLKWLIVLLLPGCTLWWGEDKKPCVYDDVVPTVPAVGYRDPSTGACDYSYGNEPCSDGCGLCPATTIPPPGWAQCNTYCDGLDESSCMATTGCHGAYLDIGDSLAPPKFYACWETAPSEGAAWAPGSPCGGLDAQNCSLRDTCSMVYTPSNGQLSKFEECIDEAPRACGIDVQCAPGSHCEQQCPQCNSVGCSIDCPATCVSDATCATVDCSPGMQCVEKCDANQCTPACVPFGTGAGECGGTVQCSSAPPTCPANTTAGVANGCWTGYCIPNADCGTPDPGQCYAQVTCTTTAPTCPSGTLPGVVNGCYSGYCIPTYACEVPACESLSSEATCGARSDCTPVYSGTDCTCTMSGCTCATETYARCESLFTPL